MPKVVQRQDLYLELENPSNPYFESILIGPFTPDEVFEWIEEIPGRCMWSIGTRDKFPDYARDEVFNPWDIDTKDL